VILSAPVPLAGHHLLDGFRCGEPELDHWLIRRARTNQVSGATRTFVVCDDDRVVAYYALASGGVATLAATGRFRRNMPDPVPVAILARLAIDTSWQGRGLGRSLFQDCAHRVSQAADLMGIRGILVHALRPQARDFYLRLGFDPSPLDPMILMVRLDDIRAAL
jgi:predicted N-acetyltransferase YhbS